eukprot:5305410-Prymnesium_polylepis.1
MRWRILFERYERRKADVSAQGVCCMVSYTQRKELERSGLRAAVSCRVQCRSVVCVGLVA